MDQSNAVLDEAYGGLSSNGLCLLKLAIRRVIADIDEPSFQARLPYVPRATGFTTDPRLLPLLVEPLYGDAPMVAVRELVQNAVDAVRELERWCENRKGRPAELDLPKLGCDVLVEYIQDGEGAWHVRVTDRGIGMTSDTLERYFLRAGASFRNSPAWAREFQDDDGRSQVARAGRFGIGAFAIFLLGPRFKLQTRHVGSSKEEGFELEADHDSETITIRRVPKLLVGTCVDVRVSEKSAMIMNLHATPDGSASVPPIHFCYCWDWPVVKHRMSWATHTWDLDPVFKLPIRVSQLPPEWAVIHPKGFDAVYWTFRGVPLSCNGIPVQDPFSRASDKRISWPRDTPLGPPCIAVVDSNGNLPLTIQRYGLATREVPFLQELVRDVTLSFIAWALVCGPTSQAEACSLRRRHPLQPLPVTHGTIHDVNHELRVPCALQGCATPAAWVPADPWLFSLLGTRTCSVLGAVGLSEPAHVYERFASAPFSPPDGNDAVLVWLTALKDPSERARRSFEDIERRCLESLAHMARAGVPALGGSVRCSVVQVLTDGRHPFQPASAGQGWKEFPSSTTSQVLYQIIEGEGTGFPDINGPLRALADWSLDHGPLPDLPLIYFAAAFQFAPSDAGPRSLMARLWEECLGPTAMPFDVAAREALTARGTGHPELGRYIRAWQEMKRIGSEWVTGHAKTA